MGNCCIFFVLYESAEIEIRFAPFLIHVSIKPHIAAPPSESFTYRKYKDITSYNLIPYLETCDATAFLSSDSVFDLESGLNCLTSNLQMAIEELAPLKRVTQRKGNKPWVGPDLQFMIRECDAIHARYGRNRDPELLREFLKLRKEIEERTEDARSAF